MAKTGGGVGRGGGAGLPRVNFRLRSTITRSGGQYVPALDIVRGGTRTRTWTGQPVGTRNEASAAIEQVRRFINLEI